MDAEETFTFTLGDALECAGCKELQKIIDKHKEEKQLSFKTLKQKIISTDQLIKQYNSKREEYDQQSKMLEDVTRKLERSKRDTEMLEGQLQSALQQLEPLKKDTQSLNATLKRKDAEIEMLHDKLQAADMLRAQFEAAAKAHQAERSQIDRSDKEKKTLNKRIESLETTKEKLEKDLCKFKDANKLLKNENKTLQKSLDKAMKTGSNVGFIGGSPPRATRERRKGFPESPLVKEKLPFSCASGTDNEFSDTVGIMDAGSSSEEEIDFDKHFALSPLSNLLSPLPPTPHDLTVQEEEVNQMSRQQNLIDNPERLSDSESGEEDDDAIDEGAAALEELITDLLPDTEDDRLKSESELTSKNEEMAQKSKSPVAAEKETNSQENTVQILASNKDNSESILVGGVSFIKDSASKDKPISLQSQPKQTSMDKSLNDAYLSTEFAVDRNKGLKTLQTHHIQVSPDKSIDLNNCKFEINENKSPTNQSPCPLQYVENNQLSKPLNVCSLEETECDLSDQKSGIVNEQESAQIINPVPTPIHPCSSMSLVETMPAISDQVEDLEVSRNPDCTVTTTDCLPSGITRTLGHSLPLSDSLNSGQGLTLASTTTEEVRVKNEEEDRKPTDLPNSETMIDHKETEIVPKEEKEIVSIIPDKENDYILDVANKENRENRIIPKKEKEIDPKEECETVSIDLNEKTEIASIIEDMVNDLANSNQEPLSRNENISVSASQNTKLQNSVACVETSGVYPEDYTVYQESSIQPSSNVAKTLTPEKVRDKIALNVTIRETSLNGSSRSGSSLANQECESVNTTAEGVKAVSIKRSPNSPDSNEFQQSMNEKSDHHPTDLVENKEQRTDIRGGDASCSSVASKDIINKDHPYYNTHNGTDSPEPMSKSQLSKGHYIERIERNIGEPEQNNPVKSDIEGSVHEFDETFDSIESKVEIIEDTNSSKEQELKSEAVSETIQDKTITIKTIKSESTEQDSLCPEHVKDKVTSPSTAEHRDLENVIHRHNVDTQSPFANSISNPELVGITRGKSGCVTSEIHEIETKSNPVCPSEETKIVETALNIKNEMTLKMDNIIVPSVENGIIGDNKKGIVRKIQNKIVRNNNEEIVSINPQEKEEATGRKNTSNRGDKRDDGEDKIKNDSSNLSPKPQSLGLPMDNNNCTKFSENLPITLNTTSDEALHDDHLINGTSLSQPELTDKEKPPLSTAYKDHTDSATKMVKTISSKNEVKSLENKSGLKEVNGFEKSISENQQSVHEDFVPRMKCSHDEFIKDESGEVSEVILQESDSVKSVDSDTSTKPPKNISDSNPASSAIGQGSGVKSPGSSVEIIKKVMASPNLSRNVTHLGDSETSKESNQNKTDHLIEKDEEMQNGFSDSSRTSQLNSESDHLVVTPPGIEMKPTGEQEISRRKAENTTQIGNIRAFQRIAHVKKNVTETEHKNLHLQDQSLSDSIDTESTGHRKTRKAKKRKRKDVKEEIIRKSPKSELNLNSNDNTGCIKDSSSFKKQPPADSTDQHDQGLGKKPVMVTQRSTGFLMSGSDLLMNATKKHPDSNTGKQNISKSKNKGVFRDSSRDPQVDVDMPSTSKAPIDLEEEFSSMDDLSGIFNLPSSPFNMLNMLQPISPLPPSPDLTNTQVIDDICLTSFSEQLEVTKKEALNDADVKLLPSFCDTNANSSIIKPSPIHPLVRSKASKAFPIESPKSFVKSCSVVKRLSDQGSIPSSAVPLNYRTCKQSIQTETAKKVLSEHPPLTDQTQKKSCVMVSSQKDTKMSDDSNQSVTGTLQSAATNKMLSDNAPCRMVTRRKSRLSSQIDAKKVTVDENTKTGGTNDTMKESDSMFKSRKQSLQTPPVTRSRADSGDKNGMRDTEIDVKGQVASVLPTKHHQVDTGDKNAMIVVDKEQVASVTPIQKHEGGSVASSEDSLACHKDNTTQGPPDHVDKAITGSTAAGPTKSNPADRYKKVICLSNTEVCELSQNRLLKRKIADLSVKESPGSSTKSVDEASEVIETTKSDKVRENPKVSKRKIVEEASDVSSKKLKPEIPQNDSSNNEAPTFPERHPQSLKEDFLNMVQNGDVASFVDKHFSKDEERMGSWRKVMLLIHEFLKENPELLSYENVSNNSKVAMLDCEEHICLLINKITTDFKECGVDMLLDILWTSSTEDGLQLPSVLSVMRMYTAICRLKGDVELARVLLYHLVLNVSDRNRLVNQILVIVGVWPLVLEKDFPKGSIMAQTLQHAILKFRAKLDAHGTKLLMKICAICNWPSDLPVGDNSRMLEKIIQYLKDHDNKRERLYEGTSSLKLLLLGEEWMFIFREFIQRHVSSVCQRWTSKSGQGSDVVYVESILSVLADVLIPCVNPDFQHIKMILQTYLTPALNTTTPITSVADCIAHVIMKLSPFAQQLSMVTLLKWFKKHKAVLPAAMKARLRQTRLTLMENFPNFKCGDFV